MKKQNQKGITLIALIITIIVMLILVGVTINVALNGGLFSKAEEAGAKTKIAQIQEAVTIKKAEVLAEKDGKAPADYGITINNLNLPTELRTEYGNKLIISKDAKLYYDASVVINTEEQNLFKSMGIQDYSENNSGTGSSQFYGVGYDVIMTETNSPVGTTCYFLDNGILIEKSEVDNNYNVVKYKLVDNTISIGETSLYILSDEYNLTLAPGIGDGSIGFNRNESKIYKYNPTYDENYNIYINAFYTSESTDNIIFTLEQGIDLDSDNPSDGYYLFNEMETLDLEISNDGEQITYNGNTYTRLK